MNVWRTLRAVMKTLLISRTNIRWTLYELLCVFSSSFSRPSSFMSHRENLPLRNIDGEMSRDSLRFWRATSRPSGNDDLLSIFLRARARYTPPSLRTSLLSSAAFAITHFRHCHSLTLRAPRLRPPITRVDNSRRRSKSMIDSHSRLSICLSARHSSATPLTSVVAKSLRK